MTEGQLKTSIEKARNALVACKAHKATKNYNPLEASRFFVRSADDIVDAYKFHTSKYFYNFLLFDDSILIIDYVIEPQLKLSFSYIANPNNYVPYEAFLKILDFSKEDILNEGNADYLREEYEQFLSEQSARKNPIYIRYDFSSDLHTPGVHPASHLHFGLENEIRIPINKVLSPKMFVLFILKQVYPENWKLLVSNDEILKTVITPSKKNCSPLSPEKFTDLDMLELFLS